MRKELKNMPLEELWKLFPIILSQHQPQWRIWANDEIEALYNILADFSPAISHIGSTAISDILAKPIVDILVEIPQGYDWAEIRKILENFDYICMSVAENRMSFNKGYTPEGFAKKVFHVHIRNVGDNDEIYFRDYLINHIDIAREYEALKRSLLPAYKNNRDGYTEAKSKFVKRVTELAKQTLFGL